MAEVESGFAVHFTMKKEKEIYIWLVLFHAADLHVF